MQNIKKYFMTLVALFAMTTGAWADKGTLLTTINASSDFTNGSKTFDNIVTVTLDAVSYSAKYGWYNSDSPHTVSVAPVDGVTVTGYTIYFSDTNPCEVEASSFTAYLINDGVYADTGMNNDLGSVGITKIEVYGPAGPAGTALTPDATRKVWTLDAMPGGNVELQVAYFPGMLTLAKSDGGCIEVVGLGEPIVAELTDIDVWNNDPTLLSAADLPGFVEISEDIAKTWNHTPASFLAEPLYYGFDGDDVEQIMFEDGAVFTRKGTITRDACYRTVKILESHIYYTTGVKMPAGFDTDGTNYYVEPKTQFQVKAVPAEGYHLVKLMAGETDITDKVDADGIATITMPEGDADLTLTATFSDEFELTFDDVNFKTNANITVKVGDADKTLDQDGKLSVKSGQTVTLTAKQGYKFRSVEAKKAVAEKPVTLATALEDGATLEVMCKSSKSGNGLQMGGNFTNNNGEFTRNNFVGESNVFSVMKATATISGTTITFATGFTSNDNYDHNVTLNTTDNTYTLTGGSNKGSVVSVKVNGTEVLDKLTELK